MIISFYRDDRPIAEPFVKLPSKKSLPYYYEVIKKPMDIKKLSQRINDNKVFADLYKSIYFLQVIWTAIFIKCEIESANSVLPWMI